MPIACFTSAFQGPAGQAGMLGAQAQRQRAVAVTTLDRYLLREMSGTFLAIMAIVTGLMMIEHLPRLLEVVKFSGSKAYVITQTLLGLIPEYAGIGSLFALYLSVGLTVRRVAMRRELDAIEASGVSPMRWMRAPLAASLLVAGFLFFNQCWLTPWGEARIQRIGREMDAGLFGYALKAGEFIELGNGATLLFDSIDREHGTVKALFLHTPTRTFSAQSGSIRIGRNGRISVTLNNGNLIGGERDGAARTLVFDRMRENDISRPARKRPDPPELELLKGITFPDLLSSGERAALAMAGSHLLWVLFALLAPWMGFVLGKPPRRTAHTFGIIAGSVLLVVFIRAAAFAQRDWPLPPLVVAASIGALCCGVAATLLATERRLGPGYVDSAIIRLYRAMQTGLSKEPKAPQGEGMRARLRHTIASKGR